MILLAISGQLNRNLLYSKIGHFTGEQTVTETSGSEGWSSSRKQQSRLLTVHGKARSNRTAPKLQTLGTGLAGDVSETPDPSIRVVR